MEYLEAMGQCDRCKDLINVDLKPLADRRGAHVLMRGKYYQIQPNRNVDFLPRALKLSHRGIVQRCGGVIHLRGGMTPLTLTDDDEPSPFPNISPRTA